MPDIICLGEPVVDMVCSQPARDLVSATSFEKAAGGAPLNVAAAAVRLGASAGVICKAGGDHFGDFMRQSLAAVGVDTEQFLQDPDYATQLAFVAVDEDGIPDFSFHVKHSADQMLRPSELDLAYLNTAEIFHFGTITLISTPVRHATLEAVQWAAEQGIMISLDVNLRSSLWPSPKETMRWSVEAIARCDFLKVSEEEMQFIIGVADPAEGAAALWEMGPELVTVTLGAEGAYVYNGHEGGHIPGFTVEVADTVGSGDAFAAGVLVGLLESDADAADIDWYSLQKIVTFANAAAALTATGQGCIPALPTRQQVAEFLETFR